MLKIHFKMFLKFIHSLKSYNCDNNCLKDPKNVLSRLKNVEGFFALRVFKDAKNTVISLGGVGAFKTVRIRER